MTSFKRLPKFVGVIAAGGLLGGLGCSDPGGDDPARRPCVLLISIDTLRADHLGCYGYRPLNYPEPVSPVIDELAAGGIRFERCFAPRGQTAPSLCSMMVGKYPSSHGVQENAQPFQGSHVTLGEILGVAGYRTGAFLSAVPTHPQGSPHRGCDEVVVGMSEAAEELSVEQWRWDEKVAQSCAQWWQEHARDRRPLFAWVHFYDVHRPWAPPQDLHSMFQSGYEGPLLATSAQSRDGFLAVDRFINEETLKGRKLSEADRRYVLSLYDAGIRGVDQKVGMLLETLRSTETLESTIIILTSDHGEELGEHNFYYYHGNSVYDSVLRIPLIIRWPKLIPAGSTGADFVQNVDLLPTLCDWLLLRTPGNVDGISFAGAVGPAGRGPSKRRDHVFSEWQDVIFAVSDGRWKYIDNPLGVHPKKPPYFGSDNLGFTIRRRELYDLLIDPGETINVIEQDGEVADSLLRLVDQHRNRAGRVRVWSTTDDPELLEKLEKLGYVGPLEGRPDVLFGAEPPR